MIAARKAREKLCPAGHCSTCFHTRYRLLLTGCCICTGHIDQKPPRLFS